MAVNFDEIPLRTVKLQPNFYSSNCKKFLILLGEKKSDYRLLKNRKAFA